MGSFLERSFGDRISFQKASSNNIMSRITPESRIDIENKVKDWLVQDYDIADGSMGKLQLNLIGDDGTHLGLDGIILFTRYEINVPVCVNGWTVYRVAESCNWPDLISVRYTQVFVNDYYPGDQLPGNTIECDHVRAERGLNVLKVAADRRSDGQVQIGEL